jgi:hypothetical protein
MVFPGKRALHTANIAQAKRPRPQQDAQPIDPQKDAGPADPILSFIDVALPFIARVVDAHNCDPVPPPQLCGGVDLKSVLARSTGAELLERGGVIGLNTLHEFVIYSPACTKELPAETRSHFSYSRYAYHDTYILHICVIIAPAITTTLCIPRYLRATKRYLGVPMRTVSTLYTIQCLPYIPW